MGLFCPVAPPASCLLEILAVKEGEQGNLSKMSSNADTGGAICQQILRSEGEGRRKPEEKSSEARRECQREWRGLANFNYVVGWGHFEYLYLSYLLR